MTRLTTLALFACGLNGCVVYADDGTYTTTTPGGTVVTNAPPFVVDAGAGVYYDPAYLDDVWALEATVDDPNGALDIIGVWADVYDGPTLIESFELYPTDDPNYWYSGWLGSTTSLDPFWPNYQVDFVVYDAFEDFGYLTVWAESY